MNRPIRTLRSSFAAATMLALFSGLPPLGQQEQLRAQANQPGDVLAPPPQRRGRRPTEHDMARINAAEQKRARRFARDLEWARRGARTQLATPRKKD